ncbi:MAG TPA: glycosyltransferase [Solirubrobacteraceae bacterium]|jgi:glycosyltransferase involved in cell wall biosynthesis|nr:glycosyltransferase [Solirubrobacteraceae bacterium]
MTGSLRRLRVLAVLDSPTDQGGAERFALGLVSHLPRDRFEPWVCSTRFATPQASESLADAGVSHISLRRTGKLDVYRLGGLAMLLRLGRFDIVHAHMFGSNVWGTVLGKLCNVPVIIAHEHNWSYSGERMRRTIDRHVIARYATRFVAVSESNRTRMIELEGIPAEKVLVLPTAYIPHRVTEPTDIRAELGVAPDAPIIGVVATLRVEKALEVMISAAAHVIQKFPDAHLVIAGDGPQRESLEAQVASMGLTGHVHFLGERRDVTPLLQTVDVGALSSDWEGMPLFVLECMATGTPVVATNVGGLPEIVEHDRTGLLVPPRDPAALAAAISALLADPERGRLLAATAAERMDSFTIETVAHRFADLYEQLVSDAAPEPDSRVAAQT